MTRSCLCPRVPGRRLTLFPDSEAENSSLPPLNELNTMFKHHVRKKKKEGNPSHPLWYTLVFAIIRTANWILLIQRVCGLPTWCSWVSLPTVTHEYTSNPKYFVYCLNRFLLLVPFPFGQITQGVSFSHKSKCKTKNTVLGIKEDIRLWILLGVGGSFSRKTSLKIKSQSNMSQHNNAPF